MSLFKRNRIWWYEFVFNGMRVRQSTKSTSKTVAANAERIRRQQLEEGHNGIVRRMQPRLLRSAASDYLEHKRPTISARTYQIEQANLKHLIPVLGGRLVSDIVGMDISRYQSMRLAEGASPKTVNLEVGTLRAILKRNRLWAQLQPDVRMLDVEEEVGRALSGHEERRLMDACFKSRSRGLSVAVQLALNTGMRSQEIRTLTWERVNLQDGWVRVKNSKTAYGENRTIPLNETGLRIMQTWAANFPNRKATDYVFASERYGKCGDTADAAVYSMDVTKPIQSYKTAWKAAKKLAGVECRFHDLRHTVCTRMLEGGSPLSVVSSIMGWSPATMVKMSRVYGHIGQEAQRQAVGHLAMPAQNQGRTSLN